MTAITTASSVITRDPSWCSGHYEPSAREAFHQHHFGRTWGISDEKIRLGLTRFDIDGHAGDERVEIQYLTEGSDLQGAVSMTDGEVSELTGGLLHAMATKKNANPGRLAFLWFCAYAAGRAFAAAVKSSRTFSPRTESSHSRSISSM